LLAATGLMIDYVLNVAVGISAGIGALTSAVPALHPYTLGLCLTVLALITIANLRGTLEAGIIFAVPTYLFVASLGGVIAFGLWQTFLAGGNPTPAVPPPAVPAASEAVTLWLLLRAFASGCTAMTGIEAVSNGVSAFRDPSVKYAHRTLATAFDGITDRLIPLFAVGAFLAFTLSQSGMAVHWSRQPRESGRLRLNYARLAINATGAVATGVSLTIILAAKFIGAWITVLVIPCVLVDRL
jgi:amino acid transporter